MSRRIAYARHWPPSGIERLDQHYEQLYADDVAALGRIGYATLYTDVVVDGEQRERDTMLDNLTAGDVVMVPRLADLARSEQELMTTLSRIFASPAAGVVALHDGTQVGRHPQRDDLVRLFDHLAISVGDYARDRSLWRNNQLMMKPRRRGKGRPPGTQMLTAVDLVEIEHALRQGQSVRELAAQYKVSPTTLRRYVDVPSVRSRPLP